MLRWARESKPWRSARQEHRLPQSICQSSAWLGERVQALALSKPRAPSRAIERPNQRFAGRESPSLGARQARAPSPAVDLPIECIAGRESPSPGSQQGRSTISRSRSANRVHRWASESKSWRLAGQEHRLPQSICHSSASLGERVQALALSKARAPSPAIDLPFECFAGRESPSLGAQQGKSTVSRSRSANRVLGWARESKPWRSASQEHRLAQSSDQTSDSLGERVQALALSKPRAPSPAVDLPIECIAGRESSSPGARQARAPSPAVDLPIECLAGRESPSLGAQQAKSTVSRNRATKPAIRWARESKPWRAAGKSTVSRSRSANRVHRWARESKPWRAAGKSTVSRSRSANRVHRWARDSPSPGAQQAKSTVSRSRSANRCQFREY